MAKTKGEPDGPGIFCAMWTMWISAGKHIKCVKNIHNFFRRLTARKTVDMWKIKFQEDFHRFYGRLRPP